MRRLSIAAMATSFGRTRSLLPELAGLLTGDKPLDRTTINSWEDIEFVQAVHATGRRKLILCALWTEICMAFTALDALREGYEVWLAQLGSHTGYAAGVLGPLILAGIGLGLVIAPVINTGTSGVAPRTQERHRRPSLSASNSAPRSAPPC